jgi:hypothetical protein
VPFASWGLSGHGRTHEVDEVELERLPAARVKVAGRLVVAGSWQLSGAGENRLKRRTGESVRCCAEGRAERRASERRRGVR